LIPRRLASPRQFKGLTMGFGGPASVLVFNGGGVPVDLEPLHK